MKTKHSLILLLFLFVPLFIVTGCDDQSQEDPFETTAVKFTSRIAMQKTVESRAADTQWSGNDRIGIYMIKNGETLADDAIAENAANRLYKAKATATNGEFLPEVEDQTIYYPMDAAEKVDFIAYYPYQTTISDYTYPVNVSNQASQAAIDLLYSDDATGMSKTNAAAELSFSHKLAKVILNIKRGEGTANDDLTQMTVVFKDMNTLGSLTLADGQFTITDGQTLADITTHAATAGSRYEAILLPEDLNGNKVEFHLNNSKKEVFVWTIGSDTGDDGIFNAATKYTYTITLDRTGVTGTASIEDWDDGPSNLTGTAN